MILTSLTIRPYDTRAREVAEAINAVLNEVMGENIEVHVRDNGSKVRKTISLWDPSLNFESLEEPVNCNGVPLWALDSHTHYRMPEDKTAQEIARDIVVNRFHVPEHLLFIATGTRQVLTWMSSEHTHHDVPRLTDEGYLPNKAR